MKCKIFLETTGIGKLELSINNWLDNNEEIKISRITQSSSGYYVVITIWYYEAPIKEVKFPEFDGIEVI